MKNPPRGLLIVFEGLDRSGKSTQTRLLADALNRRAQPSETWSYPNRTTAIGQLINRYLTRQLELDDHAVHLLFSANRWETLADMRHKLDSGVHLVVDRYAYSGAAYTAAKAHFELSWCKQCDAGLPKPDLVCFLDTKRAGSSISARDCFGAERYETSDFQRAVYDNFAQLFELESANKKQAAAVESDESFALLDASDSVDNLHQKVFELVLKRIEATASTRKSAELMDTLW